MFCFEPIGILKTCFKEKFGIPRQAGLVSHANGILKLKDHPFFKNAVRELEAFSHIWIIFVFHKHDAKNWKPSVRPPRLGGAKKVGVLASRSPHRPNPIGMSVVKLEKVDLEAEDGVELHLSGLDILDGTPVLDIKPYIAYADSISEAKGGWAEDPILRISVGFSEEAIDFIECGQGKDYPGLKELITEMLELDPRPAFQKRKIPATEPSSEGTHYGFKLFDFDIRWEIQRGRFYVREIVSFAGE